MAEKRVIELELKSNINQASKDFDSLSDSIKEVDKQATNLDATFEEVYGDLKPLTARMGEAEDRLYELAKAGKQSSQEYKDLLVSVGEYKKVQQQTDLVVDAAAQTLSSKLSGSLNAAAGGFSLVQGSMALFGSESEDVEKAMLKVQSAMAISQGIETINESSKSLKALGVVIQSTAVYQKILTAAQAAYNFVIGTTTGALKVMRIALAATGIGAIVVALGLLIANFDKVKSAVLNLVPGLASVGKIFGKVVDAVTDFVGATSDASRALDKLKKDADATLNINKKFLSEHGDQIDKYTKQKIDAKNAYATAVKEDGANQVELAKRLNRELAAIDKERNAERAKINQEAIDKEKERREKEAAKEKEAKEKALANKKKEDEKQLKEIQDRLKREQDEKDGFNANIAELEAIDNAAKEADRVAEVDAQVEAGKTLETQFQQRKSISEADRALTLADKNAKLQAAEEIAKTLDGVANLLGKSTVAGKAAAVASATISTFLSAQKAYESTVGIPFVGPVLAPINAGLAIAGGLKSIKSILAVKVPNGGGGGGSVPSVQTPQAGQTQTQSAAPQFNVVGTGGVSQIAATLGQEQAPIKAYVVSNDVTTAQSLDRNIVKTATLGG